MACAFTLAAIALVRFRRFPGRLLNRLSRVIIAGLPTAFEGRAAEIDILHVVLHVDHRGLKAHDMHLGHATE